ncbi:hypothetical protein LTR09_012486 [Extremus antarcticus]|uniref:Spherulin 4-like cell surface protein n=1 Tax=Extremus antarcticus TaxID=702011 RepID=A0AAJ0D4N8_9PEZI|nr:hypothetical protein LTR09_012486 [Extremus antarcticus]
MEAPGELLKRAKRRHKRCCISTAVLAAIVVVLIIAIPCAVLLPKQKKPMHPATILLPLYIYPSSGRWEPLSAAVERYGDVNFTVIINPLSGPGNSATPGNEYPSAIRRLNSAPNVQTVGYVRTGYTDRNINDVVDDVATYSGWSKVDSGLSVSGIFFDETPHDFSRRKQQFLITANEAVKNATGLREPKLIIHNPGTIPDARLNDPLTDVTVVFESSFDQYQELEEDLQSLPGDRSSRSIMVHSLPSGKSVDSVLQSMSRTAQYLYLTTADQGYYEHFSDSWDKVVQIMGL